MKIQADIVFLFDCDNTLLDNDRVRDDLQTHFQCTLGAISANRYWEIYESLRAELGYADYLGAIQRYRLDTQADPRVFQLSEFMLDYPFADRLYPRALEVIKHVSQWGQVIILSDGDAVFQPRKIQRSGLWQAVDGCVLIYVHKEKMLADVQQRYPARHYVMVDDKLRILTAMKDVMGKRLTTVFPRQGHYASNPESTASYPNADLIIERIGNLIQYQLSDFLYVDQVR